MFPFNNSSRLRSELAEMRGEIYSSYWRHSLIAKCAWISRDNINDLLRDSGFSGEIGLLSIDARWRDSRDKYGKLNYLTGPERFQTIENMEVYDLRQNKLAGLGSLGPHMS